MLLEIIVVTCVRSVMRLKQLSVIAHWLVVTHVS